VRVNLLPKFWIFCRALQRVRANILPLHPRYTLCERNIFNRWLEFHKLLAYLNLGCILILQIKPSYSVVFLSLLSFCHIEKYSTTLYAWRLKLINTCQDFSTKPLNNPYRMPLPITFLTLPETLKLKLPCLFNNKYHRKQTLVPKRTLSYLSFERVTFKFSPLVFNVLQERIEMT